MFLSRKHILLIALAAASASAIAQQAKTPAGNPATERSVFILPTNPREGRDPFFPESIRPYANAVVAAPAVPIINTLSIRGFSGTPGNRMVIINNHSFGIGDEGDVLTASGRIHVHCLEINDHSVVIEANNQRRELNFSTQ
ncbi:MAG: hypothetical protein ABSE48_06850 [Verrucomicrobiota bacterium]|jgi:hypothetical protein